MKVKDIGVKYILITNIKRNPNQPRTVFNQVKLQELADNIEDNGLLESIVVRRVDNEYIIIAGERRYRAHKLLEKKKIRARVIECNDKTAYELTLLENIQREDLSLLEEARGYRHLKEEYGYKLPQLAQVTSKSKSSISNIMSILNEPKRVQKYVDKGILTLAALVWIKQLPNDMEKVKLLEKLEREEVKRSDIKKYVKRVVEAYKLSERLGLKPEDILNKQERKGRPGRFDILGNVFPQDFHFHFIVDFTVTAQDLEFLPHREVLMSAYNFMHDKSALKRLSLILLDRDRLDRVFMDSGVMPAARRKHWGFFKNMSKIIDFYKSVKPDVCVNGDVPMYPFVFKNWKISKKKMLEITKRNTELFRDWRPSFKTTKVFPLQGTTPQEYLDCFFMYHKMNVFNFEDHTFGFGGLATAGAKKQREVVSYVMKDPTVRKVRERVSFVHGFGIGNPQRIVDLYQFGVNSFDALTTLVLTATGQYWLRNGKHTSHIIHEFPLTRRIRLYFNFISFWGQLAEKFAKVRGVKLTENKEKIKLEGLNEINS